MKLVFSTYRLFLLAYLFSCLLLPSGTILGFPLKFMLLLPLVLITFTSLKFNSLPKHGVFAIITLVCVLSFSGIVAVFQGIEFASAINEATAIASLAASLTFIFYAIKGGFFRTDELISSIIKMTVIFSLCKILLEVLIVIKYVDVDNLTQAVNNVFGSSLITLPLGYGLQRINLTNDWILPIGLFMLWTNVNWKTPIKWISTLSMILALFIAYSRLIWISTLISVFMIYFVNFNLNRKLIISIAISLPLATFALVYFSSAGIVVSATQAVYERYFGVAASQSDGERKFMGDALNPIVENHIFIGAGIGYYPKQYVRFKESPWLYELQWLHLTAQFGILGVILLLISLLACIMPPIMKAEQKTKLAIVSMLIFWLATGFANSFLITSVSGVIFAMFPLGALRSSKELKSILAPASNTEFFV